MNMILILIAFISGGAVYLDFISRFDLDDLEPIRIHTNPPKKQKKSKR